MQAKRRGVSIRRRGATPVVKAWPTWPLLGHQDKLHWKHTLASFTAGRGGPSGKRVQRSKYGHGTERRALEWRRRANRRWGLTTLGIKRRGALAAVIPRGRRERKPCDLRCVSGCGRVRVVSLTAVWGPIWMGQARAQPRTPRCSRTALDFQCACCGPNHTNGSG